MFLKKLTTFTIILSAIILIPSSSFGVGTKPTVNFDGDLKRVDIISDDFKNIHISRDVFRRNLGQTKQQILALFWKTFPDEKVPRSLPVIASESYNGYEIYSIGYRYSFQHKANFVLQSGLCIGYNINSPISVTDFLTDSRITGIKALPENTNYITVNIASYYNIDKVNVYETTVGTFTERYIMARRTASKEEFVVMYSFYPTDLEDKFKPEIVQKTNFNLDVIDNDPTITEIP